MFEKILILSPHTDDGELGCGGSIAKFSREGKTVFYAAFSCCEKSIPPEYPKDILRKEVSCATNVLGIEKENLFLFDYEVREFPRLRQQILDTMLELRDKIDPDIVFTPSSFDTHQDHQVIRQETLRAFKMCTILGYEQPWNNITFNTTSFMPLSEGDIARKSEALKCYGSQQGRRYVTSEFLISLARTRGVQINEDYAETFEVIRWVMR